MFKIPYQFVSSYVLKILRVENNEKKNGGSTLVVTEINKEYTGFQSLRLVF